MADTLSTEKQQRLIDMGRAVVDIEARAVTALRERIAGAFPRACQLMLGCDGRIVVLGMGKSGHVGGKIAATLASTGSPAFFVHPGEASHGDLGMLTRRDVALALSNSGETGELLTILPLIKRLGIPLITLTGKPRSTLAQAADVNLDVSVSQEACPLGLAPTASTTAALVMGDALAVAMLEARGFTEEDFALSHPGGSLGRRLLLRTADIMHTGEEIPRVNPATPLGEALLEMTRKGLGMTAVTEDGVRLEGVFTDGDLRRALDQGVDVHRVPIAEVMTRHSKTATSRMLAAEALQIMEAFKITSLVVVDDGRIVGILHMHDLLRAGVV